MTPVSQLKRGTSLCLILSAFCFLVVPSPCWLSSRYSLPLRFLDLTLRWCRTDLISQHPINILLESDLVVPQFARRHLNIILQDMMSSTQDLMLLPNELPPYSPIVYQPPVKHPYPFETEYSREPERIRAVFDDLVEKTKEMNIGKPEVPSGKRRARNLGLKVDIGQAKNLHWRSIQARHPVLLTAGPISPPRTPRRPATDYPNAEQLCLKNMADAQKKQNYLEACRWSFFAERERAIRKWEEEQAAAFHASQTASQDSTDLLNRLSPLDRLQTSILGHGESEWEKSLMPAGSVSTRAPRLEKKLHTFANSSYAHAHGNETQFPTMIEMPVPAMDRSQSLRPEAASSSYMLMGQDHMQSLNIPRGTDPSLWNARLSRSNSIQRHIPASSLRMAPTPLRPKIDHHTLSYPSPQASSAHSRS